MQTSENLGIKLPEGTDNVDIEDISESLAGIDAEFHGTTGHGHTGAAGDGPKIGSSGLAGGAATDAVIGNRTIDDTVAAASGADTPTRLWSKLANMVKAITGKSSWYTAPAASLETLNTRTGDATTSTKGIVQLDNSTSSTSTTKAATAAAVKAVKDDIDNHKSDYTSQVPYGVASGATNTYAVTLSPVLAAYTEGVALAVKINVANTGASTINVNGLGAKSILKANGSSVSSGNLKVNSVYTLRYNGTAFILQGEGGEYGTAVAAQVLTGYTIGTESGLVSGTMPNRAGDTVALASSVAGTTLKLRASAGYRDGVDDNVTITDADFTAANIRKGVDLFGITGNKLEFGTGDYAPSIRIGENRLSSVRSFSFTSTRNINDYCIVGGYLICINQAISTSGNTVEKRNLTTGALVATHLIVPLYDYARADNIIGDPDNIHAYISYTQINQGPTPSEYSQWVLKLKVSDMAIIWTTHLNSGDMTYGMTIGYGGSLLTHATGGDTDSYQSIWRVNRSTGVKTLIPQGTTFPTIMGAMQEDSSGNIYTVTIYPGSGNGSFLRKYNSSMTQMANLPLFGVRHTISIDMDKQLLYVNMRLVDASEAVYALDMSLSDATPKQILGGTRNGTFVSMYGLPFMFGRTVLTNGPFSITRFDNGLSTTASIPVSGNPQLLAALDPVTLELYTRQTAFVSPNYTLTFRVYKLETQID